MSNPYLSSTTNVSVFNIETLISTTNVTSNITDTSDVPFSIDDLINSQEVIIAKENEDRIVCLNFAQMSIDSIKTNLYSWASIAFPPAYLVSSLSVTPPAVCSDGVTRNLVEYYEWLISMTITEWLDSMNAKVSGMYFTFSHNGNSTINLHINK